MKDPELTDITTRLVTEVRNQTIADVYLALKGRVSQEELCNIYGISQVRLSQILAQRNR